MGATITNKYFCIALLIILLLVIYLYFKRRSCDGEQSIQDMFLKKRNGVSPKLGKALPKEKSSETESEEKPKKKKKKKKESMAVMENDPMVRNAYESVENKPFALNDDEKKVIMLWRTLQNA
jgi:hypothetical protein